MSPAPNTTPGVGQPPLPGVSPLLPAARTPGRAGQVTSASPGAQGPARPFADVLASVSGPGAAGDLHFSRHALERVHKRGIELDAATLNRLREGVGRAAGKGSRDSVVLVDNTAFVVSVSNRTVLTVVPHEHMREQVFTNIDSAVIA